MLVGEPRLRFGHWAMTFCGKYIIFGIFIEKQFVLIPPKIQLLWVLHLLKKI